MLNPPPVVVVRPTKSVGVAIVLSFFFGPFGMFYSTITGALVMLAVDFALFFVTILTLGFGGILYFGTWIGGIIWAAVAANQYNSMVVAPVVPVVPVMPAVQVMMPSQPYLQPGSMPPQYLPPGSMPAPYSQAAPYPPSGPMPGQYSQPGPYQQPGSQPNPYPQSGQYPQSGPYYPPQ